MRLHAVFPQSEIGADPRDVAAFGRAVEELGYDGIVAYDHVLGAHPDRPGGWTGPYTHETQFHEVFVLLGYLAAITTRVQLSPGVLILPQRQTALVAKQASAVDVLSGGRLRLGVGIGWNAVEYESLGMEFYDRGKRVEEQIALLRELFTNEVVDFTGTWHRVDRAGLNPMPVQRPIPIWIGADVERAIRRIARLGDGWFSHLKPDADGRAQLERFREWVREAGRDPATVGLEGRIQARSRSDTWARSAEMFTAMGMTDLELATMGAGYRSLDEHLEALRRFHELVSG